jgi:integrase
MVPSHILFLLAEACYLRLWRSSSFGCHQSYCSFFKAPLGKNTLGDKMKNLSKQLNLNKLYTNHSLRATTITLLDNKGFEARHIMSISGHKIESSIRSYSRTDDTQKRKIAKALSNMPLPAKKGCEMGPSVDKLTLCALPQILYCQARLWW